HRAIVANPANTRVRSHLTLLTSTARAMGHMGRAGGGRLDKRLDIAAPSPDFRAPKGNDAMSEAPRSTIDESEVARSSRLAAEWWTPNGKFRPLHKFNPVRLAYIRDQVASKFGRDARAPRPFDGLRILDIGCGGGLLCEPLARLGAEVV